MNNIGKSAYCRKTIGKDWDNFWINTKKLQIIGILILKNGGIALVAQLVKVGIILSLI